jgi:signal transduction histidine kinase
MTSQRSVTERLAHDRAPAGRTVGVPADVLPPPPADRPVDLGRFDSLPPGPEDPRPCDPRIPAPVSVAFRRAVARLRTEKEFSAACDLFAGDAVEILASVCDAVRQAHLRQRPGPVSGGPLALPIFERLRRAFVEELDAQRESLKTGQLTEALRAFDLVREEIDRDESHRFLTALRSEDAMDLVVEIAHDMRSPLTAILMLTEMIRRPRARMTDDIQQRQLGLVYSAAFGLNTLANDVIALARGSHRLIQREPVPFSMSALLHSVADMLQPIADEQGLGLRVTAPSVNGRVGQPIALSRVLLNLASNALKYTVVGEVSISAVDLCPTHVQFEVADTGPGIPPDVMPVLFEPFARRSSASRARRFSRTGLGLAICRKLLHDLGSELRVESTPERGTRFFFELPLPPADEPNPPPGLAGGTML